MKMASQLAQTGKPPEHSGGEVLLSRLLEDRATRHGERVFLDFKGEQRITYTELDETANRFANGFSKLITWKGTESVSPTNFTND